MVAGIDNWLFRGGDDFLPCEPELNNEGKVTCTVCSERKCPYWIDYNNESED